MNLSRNDITGYIDCHTHAGINYTALYKCHYPAYQSATTLHNCIAKSEMKYAIVFPNSNTIYYDVRAFWDGKGFLPSNQCAFPFEIENNYLIYEIAHFKYNNLLPFCMLSLRTKILEQIEHIKQLMKITSIYGIKLHPLADNMSILAMENYPQLIQFIESNNLPIMCHTSMDDFANPVDVKKFALRHPKIRVCAAHLARFNSDFFQDKEHFPQNLYIDCSPFLGLCQRYKSYGDDVIDLPYDRPIDVISYFIDNYPNNLLMGTDEPYSYKSKMKKDVCTFFTEYNDEMKWFNQLTTSVKQKIAHDNTIKFLFG